MQTFHKNINSTISKIGSGLLEIRNSLLGTDSYAADAAFLKDMDYAKGTIKTLNNLLELIKGRTEYCK